VEIVGRYEGGYDANRRAGGGEPQLFGRGELEPTRRPCGGSPVQASSVLPAVGDLAADYRISSQVPKCGVSIVATKRPAENDVLLTNVRWIDRDRARP
jgi:hypothetical protein